MLPADFRYAGEPLIGSATDIAVWFPASANQLAGSARSLWCLKVVARLREGVTPAQGREEVRRLGLALSDQHPEFDRGFEWDAGPLSEQVTGKQRVSMLLLLGVRFVLLMASANVANPQLARAVARQREIAVRVAMGASGYRLLRQLLTEGFVLTAMGGIGASTLALRAAMYRAIRDTVMAVPGVVNIGAVSRLPMGIPLLAGRYLDDHDEANPAAVLLVNETMARKYWPGEDVVGKRLKLSSTPERALWITVVGVVGDVRHFALDIEPRAEVYRPYAVNPLGAPILVVCTSTDAASLKSTLSARVRGVDAEIPTYNEFVMRELLERSTAERRFVMLLLAGFGLAALLIAGVGIYGTVSQAVAQRTQEIGVRMALGAPPDAVLRLVFGEGLRMMVAGLMAGGAASVGLASLMRGMLFEVRLLDPPAFLAAAATLAAFAFAACYQPARRATRVDPTVALRQE